MDKTVDEMMDIYSQSWDPTNRDQQMLQSYIMTSNMFQFVGLLDLEGTLLDVNDNALRVAGLKKSDIVGKPFWEAYWWQVDDKTVEQLKQSIKDAAKGKQVRYDVWVNAPIEGMNDLKMWIDFIMTPVKDSTGNTVFLIPEARNIDEQKKAETELINARIDAENASRAKSEFLATITHEMRTPINGIKGLSELILTQDTSDEVKRHMEMIYETSKSFSFLVDQILNYSAFEQKKVVVNEEDFELKQSIDNAVMLVKSQADQKGLAIITHVDKFWVESDKLLYNQILLNLLGNAIKFTNKGSVKIKVSKVMTANNLLIETTVEDTGIGIPKNHLDKIFDRFYRVDSLRNTSYVGTGLGLSICLNAVKMLDGDIKIDSQVGRGTRITFTIKANEGKPQSIPPQFSDAFNNIAKDFPLRILVADDNFVNRYVLTQFLQKMGYTDVGNAEDGYEVLEKMRERKYNLIFMDIRMPKLDGIKTAEILKSLHRDQCPIMVAVTANTLQVDKELYQQIGFFDHIGKPLDIGDLKEVLIKVFDYQRTRNLYRK